MTIVELIQCDGCKKDIREESSSRPFNVRYWKCNPVYSQPSSIVYSIPAEPKESKQYCPSCFNKIGGVVNDEKKDKHVRDRYGNIVTDL